MKSIPFDIVTIDAKSGMVLQGVWDGSYATWGVHQDNVIVLDSDIGKLDQLVPIYQVDLETGTFRKVGEGFGNNITIYEGLAVSSTGLLAYHNKEKLIIAEIETGEQIGEVNIVSRLYSPAWSPNGEILAYVQDAETENEKDWRGIIYLSNSVGTCRSDPLDLGSIVKSIDWLSDGQTLVFTTNDYGKIYFLDLTVGKGRELLESFQILCAK